MKTFAALSAPLLAVAAAAQCPFSSVSTQTYAPSCNFASTGFCAIVATPTTLALTLDTNACTLEVAVNAFQGCGASIPLRALVIGTQQVNVPLPEFGPTCALAVAPVALLADVSGPFTLALPNVVPPLSFLVQGCALSLPPFANELIFTLSDAQTVTLQ